MHQCVFVPGVAEAVTSLNRPRQSFNCVHADVMLSDVSVTQTHTHTISGNECLGSGLRSAFRFAHYKYFFSPMVRCLTACQCVQTNRLYFQRPNVVRSRRWSNFSTQCGAVHRFIIAGALDVQLNVGGRFQQRRRLSCFSCTSVRCFLNFFPLLCALICAQRQVNDMQWATFLLAVIRVTPCG